MDELDQNESERSALDRRAAIKKGAMAAGVVAWTAPAVVALTPSSAAAAMVTGCFPQVGFTYTPTGSNCSGYQPPLNPGPGNSCCNASTFFVGIGSTSCGGTCPGTVNVQITSATPSATSSNGVCPQLIDIGNCSGSAIAVIDFTATCPDGIQYSCSATNTVNCDNGNAGFLSYNCTPV